MDPSAIETALTNAFRECLTQGYGLSDIQRELLLTVVLKTLFPNPDSETNPLEELTTQQQQALLDFIALAEQENRSWKASILNDWLNNQDSGPVQFIREEYGFSWLNRVQPQPWQNQKAVLNLGDCIQVCNALWEWVQDDDPRQREWFDCQVIQLIPEPGSEGCLVRFANGQELEISGIYQWNRCNWRFKED